MRARVSSIAIALVMAIGVMASPRAVAAPASFDGFDGARVGDQRATALVASYPTGAQVTSVFSAAACVKAGTGCTPAVQEFTQYVAYYGDRSTGGFTMRPGFVSGVGAEYAAVKGPGSMKISVSAYGSPRQAAAAAGEIARSAGVQLGRAATARGPVAPWGNYDVWTGTSAEGDQGVIYALAGSRYVRAWIFPPSKQWSRASWRATFQGMSRLLPQIMAAATDVPVTPELRALVPPTPPALTPVFAAVQAKSAWLPFGRPDPALYDAMSPSHLSLQYAIVGAPETLALNATITPVSDTNLAQHLVDRLPSDPTAAGVEAIDGLPAGAQAVHYDDLGAPRLIYVQFVAKGAVNELTCSDLSITNDVVAGRAQCRAAIVAAATALSS